MLSAYSFSGAGIGFPTNFLETDYLPHPRWDAASDIWRRCVSLLYFVTGLLTSNAFSRYFVHLYVFHRGSKNLKH